MTRRDSAATARRRWVPRLARKARPLPKPWNPPSRPEAGLPYSEALSRLCFTINPTYPPYGIKEDIFGKRFGAAVVWAAEDLNF